MSVRGKVPPGLVWLGILIAVALLMSVILAFRIDKRLWGESRIDRVALSNPPAATKAFCYVGLPGTLFISSRRWRTFRLVRPMSALPPKADSEMASLKQLVSAN
jgi:hypothetical protein